MRYLPRWWAVGVALWLSLCGCERIGFGGGRRFVDIGDTIPPGGVGPIRVDTTADVTDPSPGDGECGSGPGTCSLRAAVEETNALGGRQEVEVPAGRYGVTRGALGIAGDLLIVGLAPGEVVLEPAVGQRGIEVGAPGTAVSVEMRGLTFSGVSAPLSGGAVRLLGGDLTLEECAFYGNAVDLEGAAVGALPGTQLSVRSCLFADNRSRASSGGAIYTEGDLDIADSTFARNHANSEGGAIVAVGSTLDISGSVFSRNAAQWGGVLELDGPAVTSITTSHFERNTANNSASVLSLTDTVLTLRDASFVGNRAFNPSATGVVYSVGSSIFASNLTFSENHGGNRAIGYFGGMNVLMECVNCTFTDNRVQMGGLFDVGGNNVRLRLINSLVARNRSGGNAAVSGVHCLDDGGGFFDLSHNNVFDYSDPQCPAGGSDVVALPQVAYGATGARADGRVVMTVPLLAQSPAIDAADPIECPALDGRGQGRVGPCDVGAHESSGGPAVTTLHYPRSWYAALVGSTLNAGALVPIASDPSATFSIHPRLPAGMTFDGATGAIGGSPLEVRPLITYFVSAHGVQGATTARLELWTEGGFVVNDTSDLGDATGDGFCSVTGASNDDNCTLRAALDEIGAGTGVVYLAANNYGLASSLSLNATRVAIMGVGPFTTTFGGATTLLNVAGGEVRIADVGIDGAGVAAQRPLVVGNAALYLSRTEISNNTAAGAIALSGGSVRAEYGVFAGNASPSDPGGAIWVDGGALSLESCELSQNTAPNGGAIYIASPPSVESSLFVSATTFSQNSATLGGAIMLSDLAGGPHSMRNVTFYDNDAGEGGAVYAECTSNALDLDIVHATFSSNVSPAAGTAWFAGGTCMARVVSSVFHRGLTGMAPAACNVALTSLGNNAIDEPDGACGLGVLAGDITGASAATFMLAPPSIAPGAFVTTLDLQPSSVLIDRGSTLNCTPTDARGAFRPTDGDSSGVQGCDVGASEL